MNETFMKERPVFPLIMSMALPMIVSMLVNSLYNIVDSFFVAQISEDAMTALSLVYPVQNLINALAIGFGVGINAAIAFFLGAGEKAKANRAAAHGFVLSAIHGAAATGVSILIMPAFLRMFTSSETVLDLGLRYSNIAFSFSLVIMLGLFKAFMPFYTKREYLYSLYLLGGAVALFTVGIVLHEAIHALAYRYVGARHVSWGANPRKFQFYVLADGEVLDYRRFRIVALAPAVAITVLALAGMAVCYNQPLFYSFLAVLGLHGLCCAGDFGLLCVFQNYGEQSVLTFDDRVRGLTCFYRRRAVPDEAEVAE